MAAPLKLEDIFSEGVLALLECKEFPLSWWYKDLLGGLGRVEASPEKIAAEKGGCTEDRNIVVDARTSCWTVTVDKRERENMEEQKVSKEEDKKQVDDDRDINI